MLKLILLLLSFSFFHKSFSQKNVQTLLPNRLTIFKNGTYFIKKTASVNVVNNSFTIPISNNILFGSYWLATSKDATIKSITVKQDTFQVKKKCTTIDDYLKANINKQIVLSTEYNLKESLAGLLLDFDENTKMIKLKTNENKIIITTASLYSKLSLNDNQSYVTYVDSVATLSTIKLNQPVNNTIVSSLSLEEGIKWYPSYLLTIINDKEATLAMKATITNQGQSFYNMDVDIVIGSPVMFYGKTLDPICTRYLNDNIFSSRENSSINFQMANSSIYEKEYATEADEDNTDATEGTKMDDLYFYKLGKLDIEKQASLIVPVFNNTINYEDIYTADIPANASAEEQEKKSLGVQHIYRIKNTTQAPLTTGAMLVVNQKEMPVSQSQINYTPQKGTQDIFIAKAIDVQIKNEELEIKREKIDRKNSSGYNYEKVNYEGNIYLKNLQNKKIKICVSKRINGMALKANLGGKIKKIKEDGGNGNSTSLIEWEVELEAGQKLTLNYNYSITVAN
jgi:hypothetical protein